MIDKIAFTDIPSDVPLTVGALKAMLSRVSDKATVTVEVADTTTFPGAAGFYIDFVNLVLAEPDSDKWYPQTCAPWEDLQPATHA